MSSSSAPSGASVPSGPTPSAWYTPPTSSPSVPSVPSGPTPSAWYTPPASTVGATTTTGVATATVQVPSQEEPINYVISAHGMPNGFGFYLPPNFSIQYYTDPRKKLVCSRSLQTHVCAGKAYANPAWKHSGWIEDYTLTADTSTSTNGTSFLSGIVDCTVMDSKQKVIFSLTKDHQFRRSMGEAEPFRSLSEFVIYIGMYHYNKYGNRPAVIHYLACRGAEEGGARKKTRRVKKRKNKTRRA